MRLTLLLSLSLVFLVNLSAQRVGEISFETPYFQFPSASLDSSYTTYSLRLTAPSSQLQEAGVTTQSILENWQLINYRKVPKGGHFHIHLTVGNFTADAVETKSKTTETKSDDGKVKRSTSYWKEVTYRLPVSVKVEDMNGQILFEDIVGVGQATHTFKNGSRNFTSAKALNDAWNKKRASVYNSLRSTALSAHPTTLSSRFRDRYDLQIKTVSSFLEFIKGRKADNAEEWEAQANAAVNVLKSIKADAPLNDLKVQLGGPLAFWEAQLANYDPSNKKEQKYYHAAAYNLAVTHCLLEEFAAAKTHATDCADRVKWNPTRPKTVLERINSTEALIAGSTHRSQHFTPRDLSAVEPPAGISYVEAVPEPPKITYDSITGYVMREDQEIHGYFIHREGGSLLLHSRRFTKFRSIDGETIPLDPSLIDGLNYSGKKYLVARINDGGSGRRPNFLRVIEDGEKMRLLELVAYYPDNNKSDARYLQTADGNRISLDFTNPRWLNWKNAFGKLFEDCPSLNQAVIAGEYPREIGAIRRAVRTYNKDCESRRR